MVQGHRELTPKGDDACSPHPHITKWGLRPGLHGKVQDSFHVKILKISEIPNFPAERALYQAPHHSSFLCLSLGRHAILSSCCYYSPWFELIHLSVLSLPLLVHFCLCVSQTHTHTHTLKFLNLRFKANLSISMSESKETPSEVPITVETTAYTQKGFLLFCLFFKLKNSWFAMLWVLRVQHSDLVFCLVFEDYIPL